MSQTPSPVVSPAPSAEPHVGQDRLALLVVGLALLLASGLAFARALAPGWKSQQAQAKRLVEERLGSQRAARLPLGFRQTWIEPLARVDRCVLCHVGVEEGPDLASLPQPARSHPHPELLAAHPVERFGCTLCHGGQGPATDQDAAHGEVPFWDEPLLTSARAAVYGLTRAELMEVRCNACHRGQAEVAGMPLLNQAKVLFRERKCTGCHTLDGHGGTTGPELGRVGDDPPEKRTFPATYGGPRTALGWHAAHIRAPASMVPGTSMRQYKFDDRQALSLALLVSSWRTLELPPGWLPGHGRGAR